VKGDFELWNVDLYFFQTSSVKKYSPLHKTPFLNLFLSAWRVLINILLFFIFISLPVQYSNSLSEEKWWVKKSTHFIVYYKQQPYPGFIEKFINKAESYYRSILETLGFRRFDFWTWDNRCKIYLESTHNDYIEGGLRPVWSRGHVNIQKRVIRSYINKDLLDTILPHEMAHLIFREFVGYKRRLPLWLDEGVATLMEEENREKRLATAKDLVKSGVFLTIDKLTQITHGTLITPPTIFYAQASSLVDFLLQAYGKRRFLDFCRCLRDKDDWERCLLESYRVSDFSQLNKKWLDFLNK
jgi:hypothetical protein